MLKIERIRDLKEIYEYQMNMIFPYKYSIDYETWKKSFIEDVDGEGRVLFKELDWKAAYEDGKMVGVIQYGKTAFGFGEDGELSKDVSYSVIRWLCFEENQKEAGRMLLNEAMNAFGSAKRVYAFFHYFGMTCFARHGKLFERYIWIEKALREYGFAVEHENVFYKSELDDVSDSDINIVWGEMTNGNQLAGQFMQGDMRVGGCEVHYLKETQTVYLRWIYINEDLQNQGLGTKCMDSLKSSLLQKGFCKLDTDTAINNYRAQHYYEKNHFRREGITRSYYFDVPSIK